MKNLFEYYNNHEQVKVNSHSRLDMHSIKYTTLGADWHDELILQARGLIINSKGEILARPFTKFFNLNEFEGSEKNADIKYLTDWEDGPFEVYDKLDGSLCIIFYSEELGMMKFASSGSLESAHAELFKDYVHKSWSARQWHRVSKLSKTYTLLFEYTAPDNRIVLNYDKPELTLLGMVNTETGCDMGYDDLELIANDLKIPLVKKLELNSKEELLGYIEETENIEGVIVRFLNSGKRLKIKTQEYVTLHRAINKVDLSNPYSEANIKLVYDLLFNETQDAGLLDDFISILFNMQHMVLYANALVKIKEHLLNELSKNERFVSLFLDNKDMFEFKNNKLVMNRKELALNPEKVFLAFNEEAYNNLVTNKDLTQNPEKSLLAFNNEGYTNRFMLLFSNDYNSFIISQQEYLNIVKAIKQITKNKKVLESLKDIYGQASNYPSIISLKSYMYKQYNPVNYIILEDVVSYFKS